MGATVQLKIEKLVAGGDGLAFIDGKACFVRLALPGELVNATLVEEKKDFCRAELSSIIEASPDRVQPPCPLYGQCGGCNLQHYAYPRQLSAKTEIVAEAFRRLGGIETNGLSIQPSAPFGYRNRLQFHLSAAGRLGFMQRLSNSPVEAAGCPVAVQAIQRWIGERAGTSRAREELAPFLSGQDRFIAYGYKDDVFLEGRDGVITVQAAGLPIQFHIKGFFQSNLAMLDSLIPDAIGGLEGGSAADLYAGVGLFSAFLGKHFERVTAVESNPYAIGLAKRNAPGKHNEYCPLSVEDWIRTKPAQAHFDCVLVDPPRTGLSPELKGWLAAQKPSLLVYVSCNPVTLARDAADLRDKGGFNLESLKAFDFYPQTNHVECLARFRPR